MTEAKMNVDQWVELFRAIGLQDADMHKWHQEFEQRYPEGHQSFLEWLNLTTERVQDIRRRSAGSA